MSGKIEDYDCPKFSKQALHYSIVNELYNCDKLIIRYSDCGFNYTEIVNRKSITDLYKYAKHSLDNRDD
jgi:hypothetical protein